MKKLKQWLYTRFLPAWCMDKLTRDNKKLLQTVEEQQREIDRLNAYINGIHRGMRRQPRIYTGEVKRN